MTALKDISLSQKFYRIVWQRNQPMLEQGRIIFIGKTKKTRRVRFPTGSAVGFKDCSQTWFGAICGAFYRLAYDYLHNPKMQRQLALAPLAARLQRLRRKLAEQGRLQA
jgi:hypothetical protein